MLDCELNSELETFNESILITIGIYGDPFFPVVHDFLLYF